MHLVAVYGFQGADDDAEMPGLTDQLFEAVLCELAVVTRVSLVCWLVTLMSSPPRSLAC